MLPLAQQFPTTELIRGTFDLMLRQMGHRGTAMRLTCSELGLPDHAVLEAITSRDPDGLLSRPH